MTERNDPCPCGSGKKYKRCCMKDFSKGGSPTVTRPASIMLRPESHQQIHSGFMMHQMAFAAVQQMREERMRDKQVRRDA